MKIQLKPNRGFTLVEIMIVVAIIGMLASIAIPSFVKARLLTQQNGCLNNIRLIEASKHQWALETKQPATALALESDLAPYVGRDPNAVTINYACPSDPTGIFLNSYIINPVSGPASCKISPLTHKLD